MPIRSLVSTLGILAAAYAAAQALPSAWPAVAGWKTQSTSGLPAANGGKSSPQTAVPLDAKGDATVSFVWLGAPATNVVASGVTVTLEEKKNAVVLANRATVDPGRPDARYPHVIDFVRRGAKREIYLDGRLLKTIPTGATWRLPTREAVVGVLGAARYNRALSAAEIAKNQVAAMDYADGLLPETKTIQLKLTLNAITEVPDPLNIKPYRNALVAQEYTVTEVGSGHMKGIRPGAKVRVFRYGVFDGKKTAVKDQKVGDKTVLNLGLLSSDPTMSHEYQLDDLDRATSILYFFELAKD